MILLVYVTKNTPRVTYVFRHICKRVLGIDIEITSKIETFVAHEGPKLSYGSKPLGQELYFQSSGLLFESGLNEVDYQVFQWNDLPCFFRIKGDKAALPFDIFSAVFFMLTRYEEYLPHVKDELGRFPYNQSIAYQNSFLHLPIVDFWILEFKKILQQKFDKIKFGIRHFEIKPQCRVSQTFKYAQKGILRSIGGSIRDLYHLDIPLITDRAKVLLGLEKDPYNNFNIWIDLYKSKPKQSTIFFSLGDFSNREKNISHSNPVHKQLLKHVSDYLPVGLQTSLDALENRKTLKQEKGRMEQIIHRETKQVCSSYYKLKLPEAYRSFVDIEIREDYSMVFENKFGFRAGTSLPFLFYDLDYEVQTPLMIHSPCMVFRKSIDIQNATLLKSKVIDYVKIIRQVSGQFIPVFGNDIFYDNDSKIDYQSILNYIWFLEDERED